MLSRDQILEQYASLLRGVEEKCEGVYNASPEIPCKNKCYECCQQLFPLTFVEAFYISEGFKKLDRTARRELQKTAKKINEKILKLNPFQFERNGVDRKEAQNTHAAFARFLQEEKYNCPALEIGEDFGNCALYDFRNLDCRVMGCSFDKSAGEIVGCHRFAKLAHLIPKLLPFNYKYPEKMELDRLLIAEVTNESFSKNIFYLTTMCEPILKDYSETDWVKFFTNKITTEQAADESCSVIID
ncbi:MAG: hypothetical protein AAB606_00245 [Patescibacteria group bacterium]